MTSPVSDAMERCARLAEQIGQCANADGSDLQAERLAEDIAAEIRAMKAKDEASPADERASIMSEWTDRPMSVGGFEFEAGQVTIADILDHAARAYLQKQDVRAEIATHHDWNEGRPGYGFQCRKCGTIMSNANHNEKCSAALSAIRNGDEGMRKALVKCRDKFLHYEHLHRLKCNAEGDEKADRNREMADMCDAALSGEAQ